MQSVLFVHHGRPHFEVLLALGDHLQDDYDLSLWSDSLHFFAREAALARTRISKFDPARHYDYHRHNGDAGPSEAQVPTELWKMLNTERLIKIRYRFSGDLSNRDIFLFAEARNLFLPVTTGLNYLKVDSPARFPVAKASRISKKAYCQMALGLKSRREMIINSNKENLNVIFSTKRSGFLLTLKPISSLQAKRSNLS